MFGGDDLEESPLLLLPKHRKENIVGYVCLNDIVPIIDGVNIACTFCCSYPNVRKAMEPAPLGLSFELKDGRVSLQKEEQRVRFVEDFCSVEPGDGRN